MAMAATARKRRIPMAVWAFGIVALSLAVMLWAATSIAAADNGPSDEGSFGIGSSAKRSASDSSSSSTTFSNVGEASSSEGSVLCASSAIDVSAGIASIEEEERAAELARQEAERKAIEEACAAQEAFDASASPELPDIDWTIGEAAFVSEWGSRINAYLSGSPLAGYGETFAQAAWDNRIDPRWSPAISNTESSKGSACFKSHNAWGWGSSSWSSWEDAINAHVAGLASAYGYSITLGAAQKYCPPNYKNWYRSTVDQMSLI